MLIATIFDEDQNFIGEIIKENGGFRIIWRSKSDNEAGKILHAIDEKLYLTFEEAEQAVYVKMHGAMVQKC